MARPSEISLLEARRRVLVAESQQLRQRLAGELQPLRAAAGWLERGYSRVQSLKPFWPLLAAGAGFFVARKRKSLLGTVGKGLSLWRLGRKVFALVRRLSER